MHSTRYTTLLAGWSPGVHGQQTNARAENFAVLTSFLAQVFESKSRLESIDSSFLSEDGDDELLSAGLAASELGTGIESTRVSVGSSSPREDGNENFNGCQQAEMRRTVP